MLKFWPITSVADIELKCGHRPPTFTGSDDVVPMEKSLMVLGVSWWLLADDGMNPASAEKAQVLYDGTYQDIISRINKGPIGHGSTGRNTGRYFTVR